jgi:hypothetical protein
MKNKVPFPLGEGIGRSCGPQGWDFAIVLNCPFWVGGCALSKLGELCCALLF